MQLGLQESVKIMGLGKPTEVLPTAWVYLQVMLRLLTARDFAYQLLRSCETMAVHNIRWEA